MNTDLLSVESLRVDYRTGRRHVRAVDDVTLDVGINETVGLVGESGSGKTTIARIVLGLAKASAGSVRFEGEDITHASRSRRRQLSKHLQVVFQDPYGSLSPTRTIEQTLTEPLLAHGIASGRAARDQAADMLGRVGLGVDALRRYPRQFSGGQRQRIAIARALMPLPRLVICDEPVSALDLSVQAQVLNLLHDLQQEYRLGYLFIAHNLAVVRHVSHRIVVLYHGAVMETGLAEDVYSRPGHPYTRALLQAVPVADPDQQAARRAATSRAEPAPAARASSGCPFAARCPYVIDACRQARPPLIAAPGGTQVACIRAEEISQTQEPGDSEHKGVTSGMEETPDDRRAGRAGSGAGAAGG